MVELADTPDLGNVTSVKIIRLVKMKKWICIILSIAIMAMLCACGTNTDNQQSVKTNKSNSSYTSTNKTSSKSDESSITDTTQYEPTETIKYNTDWTEITTTREDSDGYTFSTTFQLSPWVLLSNTDIVNSIWNEVGGDLELPGFKDWGLKKYNGKGFNNYYTRTNHDFMFFHTMTDMYYCIGKIKVTNKTEGWSISKKNPRNFSEYLFCSLVTHDINGNTNDNKICRTFYQNETKDRGGLGMSYTITDDYVEIPFILMVPENFSPKYPNGEYYDTIRECTFSTYDKTEVKIGIIGKDGKYYPPSP